MAYNFIHRILNADIPPPESSWKKIAAALDKGAAPSFVEKLSHATVEPPASGWQRIATALDATYVERKDGVIPIWLQWSAAAIVVGIIIISASYFLNVHPSTKNVANNSGTSEKTNGTVESNRGRQNISSGMNTSKDTTSILEQGDLAVNNDTEKPEGRQRQTFRVRHAVIETAEADKGIPLKETQPNISDNVSPESAKYIPAPDYFVVTAPNGQRTKISIKFSNAVASLMGSDNDNVDYLWKSRFDNWKSKLISNPTFIPAAGNFLDIAELKDLIKEQ